MVEGEAGLIGSPWSREKLQARLDRLQLDAQRLRGRALELQSWTFERRAVYEEQQWRMRQAQALPLPRASGE